MRGVNDDIGVLVFSGRPDKNLADKSYEGGKSDIFWYEETWGDLTGSVIVTPYEEYSWNTAGFEDLQDAYDLDIYIPDLDPSTSIDD